MTFTRLLSPLDLGPVQLRNRVQVTGHTTFNVDRDQLPNDDDVAYFAARAAGGAALVTMGATAVHPSSPMPHGIYANTDDRIVPRYRQLSEAVHEHGALIIPQLGHMSQRAAGHEGPIWAPSPVSFHSLGRVPHAMTVSEIALVVDAFAQAARRAMLGGMDGVELAVGHGQLINGFLSPLTNTRTDAYGGSFEARLRFVLEIIDAVRAVVGSSGIVATRVNGSDEVAGSLEQEDWLQICEAIAATGLVDYLNVSANFHGSVIPTMATEHGCYVGYARAVKQRVAIPVFCVGRITDPELAERVLAEGAADVIGMTRAHIADPDLVRKLVEGRRAQIRPCVGCVQMCAGELWRDRNVKCIYNAATGFERSRLGADTAPAASTRRVVVVGGGPAGLEAARVAAGRGHEVILFERSEQLGGTVRLAARPPTRAELARTVDWLGSEVERLGVDVRRGQTVDADVVMAASPDAVIVATGATSAAPPWTGGSERVISGRDLLAREQPPASARVLVVDDDHRSQALVLAAHLASFGLQVRVISPRPAIAELLEPETLVDLLELLYRGGAVQIAIATTCTAIEETEGGVLATLHDGATGTDRAEPFDLVVHTWARPDDHLAGALEGRVEVHVVGDAVSPHRIEAAVHGAFLVAAAI